MGFLKHFVARLFRGSHKRGYGAREHDGGYGYPSEHGFYRRDEYGERRSHHEGEHESYGYGSEHDARRREHHGGGHH